jgi:hypothetical protein
VDRSKKQGIYMEDNTRCVVPDIDMQISDNNFLNTTGVDQIFIQGDTSLYPRDARISGTIFDSRPVKRCRRGLNVTSGTVLATALLSRNSDTTVGSGAGIFAVAPGVVNKVATQQ